MKKAAVRSIPVVVMLLALGVMAEAQLGFTMIAGYIGNQQTGKIFRIGFLDSSNASGMAGLLGAFQQELNKLGWIEGKNITIEHRFAERKA